MQDGLQNSDLIMIKENDRKEFRICFMFVYGANWYTADQNTKPQPPKKVYNENKNIPILQLQITMFTFYCEFPVVLLHHNTSQPLNEVTFTPSHYTVGITEENTYYFLLLKGTLCALNILPHLIFTTLSQVRQR